MQYLILLFTRWAIFKVVNKKDTESTVDISLASAFYLMKKASEHENNLSTAVNRAKRGREEKRACGTCHKGLSEDKSQFDSGS